MRKGYVLAGALALCGCVSPVEARPASNVMSKIYFVPVKPRVPEQQVDLPGNIHIVYSDGRDVKVTKSGTAAFKAYHAPRIAPDRRTAAWLEGRYEARSYFAPTSLVVYRNGRVRYRIKGQLAFIENWFFWNGGRQIAVQSRMGHGPVVNALHDATTGRLIQKTSLGERIDAGDKIPAWAEKLGS